MEKLFKGIKMHRRRAVEFDDIPHWRENLKVRKAVEDAVLAEADMAEFLSEDGNYQLEHISELYGTDYEDIVAAYLGSKSRYSYDMWGKLYYFALTPELRAHIKREGLNGIFVTNDGAYALANLTLYKDGQRIFSCI